MPSPESISIKKSLSGETYAEIRQALLQGTFKPGQRLSESELALRFGTSRSPVREALMRLEHEGLIEKTSSGTVRVKALAISDFEQLNVVRATLEGLAVRLAAPRLRTLDLESMSEKLDEMERCMKKGDAVQTVSAGRDFHDVIARECGNQLVVELLSSLRDRASRFRITVASLGNYDPERIAEHRRILKALYQRNAEKAEAEMIRHVNRSAEALVVKLRKRTGSQR